jgi:hypothetical protein
VGGAGLSNDGDHRAAYFVIILFASTFGDAKPDSFNPMPEFVYGSMHAMKGSDE